MRIRLVFDYNNKRLFQVLVHEISEVIKNKYARQRQIDNKQLTYFDFM